MRKLGALVPHVVLVLFSLYVLLPPLWVLRTSFVPDSAAYKVALLPEVTLAAPEGGSLGGRGIRRRPGCFQMRHHRPAERGELGQAALAVKQGPAQLLLQALDSAGQRRLGDVAGLCSPGEVQRPG